jgi:uncharacterized protein (TIGR03437 family)
VLFLCGSLCASAQGWIYSVANSASYSPRVAQGSIFVVMGWDIGPDQLVQAPKYPLDTTLSGTSVQVTVSGTPVLCPMVYTSSRQVAAILPSDTPIGVGTLEVIHNGLPSYGGSITVVKTGFGIYTTSAAGAGPGSITGNDYALNTFAHTTRARDVLVLWGTGLGPAPGEDGAGPQGGVQFDNVSVYIGNQKAKVIYAGRSGGYAGLDQINVEVPDVPDGCFVPVVVHSESEVSNYVTIAVDSAGKACANPSGVPADLLASAAGGGSLRLGAIALGPMGVLQGGGFRVTLSAAERVSAVLGVQVAESDVVQLVRAMRSRNQKAIRQILSKYKIAASDLTPSVMQRVRKAVRMDHLAAAAAFGAYSNLGIAAPQLGALSPASGTCTVMKFVPSGAGSVSRGLDAGSSLTLTGPLGSRVLHWYTNGEYQADLGAGFGSTLPPGTYQVTGSGGADVPAFTASFTVATSLVWSNKAAVSAIDRTQPLTVTWSGGPETGHVLIGGWSRGVESGAAFACVEEANKGTFTIPPHVLTALPTSYSADSHMFLAQHPLENRLSVEGLDLAYVVNASSDYAQVAFR